MLLMLTILVPAVAGTLISACFHEDRARRRWYTALIVLTDLLGVLTIVQGGRITPLVFAPGAEMTFSMDALGRYVMAAVLLLYTSSGVYAFKYMEKEERTQVFFAFYFISFGALLSVTMAGNLVTLYFCFEMATLSTVPLVLHELTKEAVAAGLKYLFYSIGGALMGLFAVFIVCTNTNGSNDFVMGGFLDPALAADHREMLLAAVMVGIVGFGTKAGLYPMHGWLPAAHPIAPAPASALLSGIVAKAGVVAVIRLVYYSVGTDFLRGTWVQTVWMVLALLTIFMGSMMAFREKNMKKRLAYSTVSQISYILLGLSFLSADGLKGGLLHLMAHAASKGCLFLAAGVFIFQLGIRDVAGLKGIGKKMPVTMICFTMASLSLVGIPPMGGFLSKWVIATASLESGIKGFSVAAPVMLLISALLTAGYLLTVAVDAFFPVRTEILSSGRNMQVKASGIPKRETKRNEKAAAGKDEPVQASVSGGDGAAPTQEAVASAEPSPLLVWPMVALSIAALIMGIWGESVLGLFGL